MGNQYDKKTLYDWCIENNRQDILYYWDYELNDKTPKDIGFSSNKKYWFKCKRHLHESYQKDLITIKNGKLKDSDNYYCPKCNSIGQYIINKFGYNHLNEIWSNKNVVTPFDLSYSSGKKIWIRCVDDKTHPDYEIICSNFIKDTRCPYCSGKKVCLTNSLGYLYPEIFDVWSDKNKKSPYEYTCGSNSFIWLKCNKGIHNDYKCKVYDAVSRNFI